jgi:hypothetical protein
LFSGAAVCVFVLRDDGDELEKCRASWTDRWDAILAVGEDFPRNVDDGGVEGMLREGAIAAACVCTGRKLAISLDFDVVLLLVVKEGWEWEPPATVDGGGGVMKFLVGLGPADKRGDSV